jgi:uncharacterized protein
MTPKEIIDDFLSSERIAVAGVSRDKKKFGNIVFKDLKRKGYNVVPVNPNVDDIEGTKCYSSLDDIPGEIQAVISVTSPDKTLTMLKDLKRKDIRDFWMIKGSESIEAVEFCNKAGINAVAGECILMFAQPEGFHKFHRFINKVFGKLPA